MLGSLRRGSCQEVLREDLEGGVLYKISLLAGSFVFLQGKQPGGWSPLVKILPRLFVFLLL